MVSRYKPLTFTLDTCLNPRHVVGGEMEPSDHAVLARLHQQALPGFRRKQLDDWNRLAWESTGSFWVRGRETILEIHHPGVDSLVHTLRHSPATQLLATALASQGRIREKLGLMRHPQMLRRRSHSLLQAPRRGRPAPIHHGRTRPRLPIVPETTHVVTQSRHSEVALGLCLDSRANTLGAGEHVLNSLPEWLWRILEELAAVLELDACAEVHQTVVDGVTAGRWMDGEVWRGVIRHVKNQRSGGWFCEGSRVQVRLWISLAYADDGHVSVFCLSGPGVWTMVETHVLICNRSPKELGRIRGCIGASLLPPGSPSPHPAFIG